MLVLLEILGLIVIKSIKKGRNLMKPHNEGLKPRFQIKFIISTLVISIEDGTFHAFSLTESETNRCADPGHLGKYGRSLTPLPSADQKFREKFSFYQPEFLAVLDDYLVVRTEKSALEEFIKERQQIMNDTLKVQNNICLRGATVECSSVREYFLQMGEEV